MTTTVLRAVKSMVSELEYIRDLEIISKAIEGIEFLTLLTLPILLPLGIMFLASAGY